MVDNGVFFLADDMDLPEPDYKVPKEHWDVIFKQTLWSARWKYDEKNSFAF